MGVYLKQRADGSNAWFYDFTHSGVRYRGVGGTTKTQALRVLEKKRAQLLNLEHEIERPKNPQIDDFSKKFLERRKDHRSFRRDVILVKHLLRKFNGQHLSMIRMEDVEDYKVWRKAEGVSNATINRELACLKRMYNLAIQWGDTKRNPVSRVRFLEEANHRDRFLTEEEAARLIHACADYFRPIVIAGLNTGMRLQEILNLQWQQVYVDESYIEILKTKNSEKRYVPLNNSMISLFSRLERQSNYVFLGLRGNPLQSIRKPWAHAKKRAGIEESFRFHDLRHTFISHMVMKGVDLLTIAHIVGHKDIKLIMDRYGHLASDHKNKAVNVINGMFSDSL